MRCLCPHAPTAPSSNRHFTVTWSSPRARRPEPYRAPLRPRGCGWCDAFSRLGHTAPSLLALRGCPYRPSQRWPSTGPSCSRISARGPAPAPLRGISPASRRWKRTHLTARERSSLSSREVDAATHRIEAWISGLDIRNTSKAWASPADYIFDGSHSPVTLMASVGRRPPATKGRDRAVPPLRKEDLVT
jgi:hypothetical protein